MTTKYQILFDDRHSFMFPSYQDAMMHLEHLKGYYRPKKIQIFKHTTTTEELDFERYLVD